MRSAARVIADAARDGALCRVVAAFTLFAVTEYAIWIAVLVYAYGHGGATAAGAVAAVQLIPGALLAPVLAGAADRRPIAMLSGGYLAQGLFAVLLAVAMSSGAPPYVAYGVAVLLTVAVGTIRPAQAAVIPALTRDVRALTAANVLVSWAESVGIVLAGLGTGVALSLAGTAAVPAASAVLLIVAAGLVFRLQVSGIAQDGTSKRADARSGLPAVLSQPGARALVTTATAEYVVLGALDVIFVVLALEVLHQDRAWAAYLNTAFGLGGVVVVAFTITLVGRRLAPAMAGAAVAIAVALALAVVVPGPLAVAALLVVVGAGRAVVDVCLRILLQRTVAAELVARAFGVVEGMSMLALAVGSLAAGLLVAVGGPTAAVVAVSAMLPLVLARQWRVLRRADETAHVPVVEIALLRSMRLFRDLPAPALAGVAAGLRRVELDAGAVVMREGDPGDRFYAVADGDLAVSRQGRLVRSLHRGAGIGEIALLHEVPRTATVTATTPVVLYELDRTPFLAAVAQHVPLQRAARDVVAELQAADASGDAVRPAPGSSPPRGSGRTDP